MHSCLPFNNLQAIAILDIASLLLFCPFETSFFTMTAFLLSDDISCKINMVTMKMMHHNSFCLF
jgi:hypothetical protein